MNWIPLTMMLPVLAQAAPPPGPGWGSPPPVAPPAGVSVTTVLPEPVPVPMPPPVSSWRGAGDDYEPDVYPSQRSAARALGARWAKQAAAGDTKPGRVVLAGAPAHLADEMRRAMEPHLPAVEFVRAEGVVGAAGRAGDPGCSEARVVFELAVAPADVDVHNGRGSDGGHVVAADSRVVVESRGRTVRSAARATRPRPAERAPSGVRAGTTGTMTLTATGVTTATASVRFVDKPWVDEFPEFTARNPGRRWVVGRSPHTAMDAAEADRLARSDAAEKLTPIVMARLAEHGITRGVRFDELRRWVEGRLHGDRHVADRFVQTFDRGYHTMWGQAVLVDASAPVTAELSGDFAHEYGARRSDGKKAFVGTVVLIAVSFLLYKFVNAYTKGYFTWSLRTAVVVVVVAGVLLLMVIG